MIHYEDDKVHGVNAYMVPPLPAKIKEEIYTYGPITGAFTVYEDSLTYKSGVYQHMSGAALGGHAIKVIGWGEEDGLNYWL